MENQGCLWGIFPCIYRLYNLHAYLRIGPRTVFYSLLLPPARPPLVVVVAGPPVIPLYASTRTQRGTAAQRVLKKNKYTHLYLKLDVSRLGEPLSHSGANIIHPALDRCECVRCEVKQPTDRPTNRPTNRPSWRIPATKMAKKDERTD